MALDAGTLTEWGMLNEHIGKYTQYARVLLWSIHALQQYAST